MKRTTSLASLPARAESLARDLPVDRLHPAVRAWAARRPRRETWGVALSGGADSVALLLLLWAHFPAWRKKLVALHFNHRLRGRAAADDARFCRALCRRLGVKLVTGEWKRRALRTGRATPSEAGARAARHEFFVVAMKRLRTSVLWLGHQQDDVAESLLMRLARGSGTSGLAAPRPVQPMPDGRTHLRPLLGLRKSELAAGLQAAGVSWREDATNLAPDFLRNRVRARVVPAWVRASGRDAVAGAALSRERLDEDDAALEAWLDELAPVTPAGRLQLARLSGKPTAIWRRALHRWMVRVRPSTDLSRQGFEQLLALVRRGRPARFSLGAKGFAVIAGGVLRFVDR